ncbi:TetR family transcriptional regulator [Streptomyces purpureus]|uniref:TetR family transcriptional regulator n=1 Tax=Streptomyces purpureus TaxID=1951 RepID=A0A918HHV8_9ACTN|nr:TetR family transcriptional regulator [Streptomyces purpureus]
MRTRRALIVAAAEAFEGGGYAEAKVGRIAAAAGVSPGALHFHFENKNTLADAVVAQAADRLGAAAREVHARRGTPLQTLADLTHSFAALFRTDVVVRAGFRLNSDGDAELALGLRDEWHHKVAALIGRASAAGELTTGLPHSAAVTFVAAATAGLEMLGRGDEKWLSHATLTEFWRAALSMLATPEAARAVRPEGVAVLLGGGHDETPRGVPA